MCAVWEACPAVGHLEASLGVKSRIHCDDMVEKGHTLSSIPHVSWVSPRLVTACRLRVCLFLLGSWYGWRMAGLGAINRNHSESPVPANEPWALSHSFWCLCMQTSPFTLHSCQSQPFCYNSLQVHRITEISINNVTTHFAENVFRSSLLYYNTLFGKYASMVMF